MAIKSDRLICFSNGFQHITQLDKGFRLIYNMMGIDYQMVTWPIWAATHMGWVIIWKKTYNVVYHSKANEKLSVMLKTAWKMD